QRQIHPRQSGKITPFLNPLGSPVQQPETGSITPNILGSITAIRDTWGYTKDDKVASIKVTGATQSTPDTTFTWDSYYPRVRQMVDAIGTTTYDYVPPGTNGALQLKCDSGAWANNAICHTYDELGRLSSRSVQSADGTDTSTWAYDALGRVLQQSLAKLGVFSYEYLGDTAQVTRRTAPGGIVSTFDYGDNEADRRLSKITHPVPTGLTSPIIGGSPRHVFSYESNPLGQVTRLLSTSSGSPQNSRDQVFGYDLADRLISKAESSSDPSTPGVSMTQYQRDAADNIVKIPAASTPGSFFEPSATFQVNQLNQATSQDGGSRTHDLNGNVLMDQASTYTWDGLDRLVRRAARTSPSVSTWRYDGWNRRAELTENGVTRRYRWCGDEICAVMDTTNKVRVLQHGDRGEVNAGRALVYGEDHLGNVRHVYSGTTGKWLAGIDYDSHGRAKDIKCVLVADCQLPTNGGLSKGYAGLYWHGLSGLYLATYRAYDPRAMRWLSRDPIEEAGGDNLYAYVDGNPINLSDSAGLARGDQSWCKRQKERVDNIQNKINERVGELKENPMNLPEACPGDDLLPSLSRRGHRKLINVDKANLAAQKALYDAYCKGPPAPPAPAAPYGSPGSGTATDLSNGEVAAAAAAAAAAGVSMCVPCSIGVAIGGLAAQGR
ncbi:RHS repeat domain-containing protein, partial [Aquabacterium parvum]|uniref:RHS repeat domain-containing protein n=1 Tax=Aquabacterium parvum TaxID=70584 RepID=UPI000B0A048D